MNLFKNLSDYDPLYVPSGWQTVSVRHVANVVLRSCPDLDFSFVCQEIEKYDNGTVYSFEVSLWVEYFKCRIYCE